MQLAKGKKYFYKPISWLFRLVFFFFLLFWPFPPFFPSFSFFFLPFSKFLESLPTVAAGASPRRGCVYPGGTLFVTGAGSLRCVNMWREPRDSASKHPPAASQRRGHFFSLPGSSRGLHPAGAGPKPPGCCSPLGAEPKPPAVLGLRRGSVAPALCRPLGPRAESIPVVQFPWSCRRIVPSLLRYEWGN